MSNWFPKFSPAGEIRGAVGWLDNTSYVFNNGAGLSKHDVPADKDTVLWDKSGAVEVVAGGGKWAFQRIATLGVQSSERGFIPEAGAPTMNQRGQLAWVSPRNSEIKTLYFEGKAVASGRVNEPSLSNTLLVWKVGKAEIWSLRLDVPNAVPQMEPATVYNRMRPIAIDTPEGPYILTHTDMGHCVTKVGTSLGWHTDTGAQSYYPDAICLDGIIKVARTTSQGALKVDLYPLASAKTDLGQAPTPPVTAPAVEGVRAFPRKVWIAPFFSFGKYGDTDLKDYLTYGNAATLVGDERDPKVFTQEVARVSKLGLPLICSDTTNHSSTVAWWASGKDLAELEGKTAEACKRHKKPVIAYLDKSEAHAWPKDKPKWITAQVWPSVQAYRFPGESLTAFQMRCEAQLSTLTKWGSYIVLVPRFDDFNGSSTVEAIVECMPTYIQWIRRFPVVGVMPFADRRGKGISADPRLKVWAQAFMQANPDRPNRFDYWSSGNVTAQLRNKLGQTTELLALSPEEKLYLLERL